MRDILQLSRVTLVVAEINDDNQSETALPPSRPELQKSTLAARDAFPRGLVQELHDDRHALLEQLRSLASPLGGRLGILPGVDKGQRARPRREELRIGLLPGLDQRVICC